MNYSYHIYAYWYTQPSKSPENASSVLVQLLAILRNLSDSGSSRDRLLATDSLLDYLCSVLLYHCCDPDVAFNLCRLLRYVRMCVCVYACLRLCVVCVCMLVRLFSINVCVHTCVFYHYSKLTQHNDHRSIVMQHLDSALPAFVGLLADHMTNPVIT